MPNAPAPPENRLVVALAYDRLCTFELGVAVEIFGLHRPEMGPGWYRFAVAAMEPGPLRAMGGLAITCDAGPDLLDRAGTIIVPGWRGADEPVPEAITQALRRAHVRGSRVLSLCSGVFVLAAAGLLEGKTCTTHWRYAERLAATYPTIAVTPDVLYVDEGTVLTAAGSAAAIDLCLHLIRRDFGAAAANAVARRLVVPPHREGGQAQFVEAPVVREREGARFGALLDGLRTALDRPHTIATMAAAAGMGARTFQRRFKATTGLAPAEWLVRERIARARTLLETTDASLEDVAGACGFGALATLRHHFRARLGASPSAYRRRFRGCDGA